ncbi:hypothetical protein [Nitrobacter sp. JJSN]|uniref:hypothetical protein n=1 Tax=Nitrobacter sp. JJSN TaxID=3453033 RepID=UPI003F77692D
MKTKNRDRDRFTYKPRTPESREPRKANTTQSRESHTPRTATQSRDTQKRALLLDGLVEQIKTGSSLARLYAGLLATTLLDEEEQSSQRRKSKTRSRGNVRAEDS